MGWFLARPCRREGYQVGYRKSTALQAPWQGRRQSDIL